jgi:hypothetical protein
MNNKIRQERLGLARRLRSCGVPLEIPEDENPHFPACGLIIRQIEGTMTQFDVCEVGYQVFLRATNNLDCPFYICGFRLHLPWKDKNLCLLHDPYDFVPRHSRYRFLSGREPSFPRNEVLNHIYLEKLSRGFPLEGQILWTGGVPIPDEYVSGSKVAAFVAIVDQYGAEYTEPISLRVQRKVCQQVLRKGRRRSITGNVIAEPSIDKVPERETQREVATMVAVSQNGEGAKNP